MIDRTRQKPSSGAATAQGSDRPPGRAENQPAPRPESRLRQLEAEVARLRAECQDCRLIAELSRERDTATLRADKLVELEHLKSDFFADVSHEFRTPLTLILGPLRDLAAGDCGELPAEARQQVELASRNAERLRGLVEQILDTARLDAGEMKLRLRRCDLAGLLADIVEGFCGLAERRRARLVFEPPGPIPIRGDPIQLEKVFSNLLANALRYNAEGGRVEINVEHPEASMVTVTVRDQGPGIAPEDQERVFDRFYRVSETVAGGLPGTGLGLPLARRLVELHGGSLTLESASGEGCVFRVELPLGQQGSARGRTVDLPAATARPDKRHRDKRHRDKRHPDQRHPDQRHPDQRRQGKAASSAEAADRTTVLVVDDHPGIRTFVRRHLEARYRVEEAADGAAALALTRELLPDLVVSDVMMPEMDGYALCRAIKQDSELDWVPVVLITARAETGDKIEGLEEGADDYLTKPFDVRELVARVDNLIVSRRRLRERFAAGGPPLRLPVACGVRPTAEERRWLARVRDAIEAGLGEDALSVADLAAALAIDRSQLFRRLQQLTGRSPSGLIAESRLQRAATLLRHQDASVSEVAYDAGFHSVSHFSRRFHERFECSPSAWRRQPP